jgi:hypothetical protein
MSIPSDPRFRDTMQDRTAGLARHATRLGMSALPELLRSEPGQQQRHSPPESSLKHPYLFCCALPVCAGHFCYCNVSNQSLILLLPGEHAGDQLPAKYVFDGKTPSRAAIKYERFYRNAPAAVQSLPERERLQEGTPGIHKNSKIQASIVF